jgi:hypothetical protein
MKKTITYHIWPRDIDFGEKFGSLMEYMDSKGFKIEEGNTRITRFLITENKYNHYKIDFIEEFLELINKLDYIQGFNIILRFIKNDYTQDINLFFDYNEFSIDVSVGTENNDFLETVHNFIKENFNLDNPYLNSDDQKRAFYPNPTIFIGRHFDENASLKYRKLSDFLTLIGFNIKEGEDYSSSSIPEQVKSRIESQDIFIALITGNNSHEWIISETSYAHGKDKHIILIVENGSNFNPSILGNDLEQIRFSPECIEKSFHKLIREFISIKVKGIF